MGTPIDHLPGLLSNDMINELLVTIGLPKAVSITSPDVTAQYHAIYCIKVRPSDSSSHTDLILRVSGHHLPAIKTENAVGVMSWVSQNTSIPIPELIAFDATTANPLGYEYTLLSRSKGDTLSEIYQSLGTKQIEQIVDQLIDILAQLHQHERQEIGGLRRTSQGCIIVAQVLDETFWQNPDIEKFWPPGETVASLNIQGPYSSYVAYISAQVRKYIELIKRHHSLSFLRDTIPRLEAFVNVLPEHSLELNKVKLRLAHKDLHFANMLYDVASGRITAILDWEFAGVVPMTKWNPRRAFLWNGRNEEESSKDQQRLMHVFARRCEERGLSILADAAYTSEAQESMQKVADYLRAITEVAPRGQRQDLVPKWVAEVLGNIAHFGV